MHKSWGALTVSMALVLLVAGCSAKRETTEAATRQTSQTLETDTKAEDVEAQAEEAFYIKEIDDELFARIKGKSFKEDCTLPREDLRYLHVLHKDLDGNTHEAGLHPIRGAEAFQA